MSLNQIIGVYRGRCPRARGGFVNYRGPTTTYVRPGYRPPRFVLQDFQDSDNSTTTGTVVEEEPSWPPGPIEQQQQQPSWPPGPIEQQQQQPSWPPGPIEQLLGMTPYLPTDMWMMYPPPIFHPTLMPPTAGSIPDEQPRSGVLLTEQQFYQEQQRLLEEERKMEAFERGVAQSTSYFIPAPHRQPLHAPRGAWSQSRVRSRSGDRSAQHVRGAPQGRSPSRSHTPPIKRRRSRSPPHPSANRQHSRSTAARQQTKPTKEVKKPSWKHSQYPPPMMVGGGVQHRSPIRHRGELPQSMLQRGVYREREGRVDEKYVKEEDMSRDDRTSFDARSLISTKSVARHSSRGSSGYGGSSGVGTREGSSWSHRGEGSEEKQDLRVLLMDARKRRERAQEISRMATYHADPPTPRHHHRKEESPPSVLSRFNVRLEGSTMSVTAFQSSGRELKRERDRSEEKSSRASSKHKRSKHESGKRSSHRKKQEKEEKKKKQEEEEEKVRQRNSFHRKVSVMEEDEFEPDYDEESLSGEEVDAKKSRTKEDDDQRAGEGKSAAKTQDSGTEYESGVRSKHSKSKKHKKDKKKSKKHRKHKPDAN